MLTATLAIQFLLLVYHQLTTLCDWYPFNNVRSYSIKERLTECGINGFIMASPLIGFYFHIPWMMMAALLIYPVLLIGEYLSWWKPYFFGGSEAWQITYNRLFKNTLIVLPAIKDHPVPNLEHTLLHGLTLATTVITYIAYFTAF